MSAPVGGVDADGRVTLHLNPDDAKVLAELLQRWHSLMTVSAESLVPQLHDDPADPAAPALALYDVEGWDPHTWLTVTTELLVARAQVDDSTLRHLRVVTERPDSIDPADAFWTSRYELVLTGGGA